ncbi:MAG: hypothetical protein VB013_07970 [Anaerolineaceae bacterium]|nr:hypothetical protein [Anaerolineaceae bacterium]
MFKHKSVLYILLLAVLFTIYLVDSLRMMPFAFDDAYIHFRIAENFARLGRPYYNPTEPVFTTSSFIWTCILTFFAKINLPLTVAVAVSNAFISVLGAWLWSRFLRPNIEKYPRAFEYLFMVVYIGAILPSAVGLMEAPFALLLLGLAINLIGRQNQWGMALLGVAVYIRYEFAVFVILIGLYWLIRTKSWRERIIGLIAFLVPFGLVTGVIFHYFGTLVPNTVYAKQMIYYVRLQNVINNVFFSIFPSGKFVLALGAQSGNATVQSLAALFPPVWKAVLVLVIISALTFLIYKNPHVRINSLKGNLVILLGGLGIATGYIVKKVFLFDWYLPLYIIPILLGIYAIAQFELRKDDSESLSATWITRSRRVSIIILTICVSLQPIYNLAAYSYASFFDLTKIPSAPMSLRVQRYMEIGRVLNDEFPNATLLTNEIGGLGMGFRGKIIDVSGLVSPEVFQYFPGVDDDAEANKTSGTLYDKIIGVVRPDLIVTYPLLVGNFDSSSEKTDYVKLTVPALARYWQGVTGYSDVWGSPDLYIYVRKEVLTPELEADVLLKIEQQDRLHK